MKIEFAKYHGCGNDFIIIDNREYNLPRENEALYKFLCKRHFGIGADGLILIQESAGYDFEMIYYNADGTESSMCGNGGRCVAMHAVRLGLADKRMTFQAIDGEHEARLRNDGSVTLKMNPVYTIETGIGYYFLDTGSPHWVEFKDNIDFNIVEAGRKVRMNHRFRVDGTNVDYVKVIGDNSLKIRTYERGVEDETLACGTGVVAAALVHIHKKSVVGKATISVETKGGNMTVECQSLGSSNFDDIWLTGPAKLVFNGTIDI